jgi:O-antigen/teichoic acid export membrane protein
MKFIPSFKEGSLARNASWMFLGQGMSFVVQAAYFILLARLLGSQQYGIFVGAFALVSIVSQYSTMGSGLVMLRHVSQDRSKFGEYWGNVILTTFSVGFLVIILLKVFSKWIVGPSSASVVVLVALGECTCARLSECAGQAFQAFENLRWTATLTTLTNITRLIAVGVLMLLFRHATVMQWATTSVIVSVISAIVAVSAVSYLIGRPKFRPRLLVDSAAEGIGFSFACSTTSVYNDLDKTMLSHYGMTAANGVYSMAYKVIDISCAPIRALHSAAFPKFCQKGMEGARASIDFTKQLLRKTLPYALVAAAGMFLTARFIPMIVGKSFESSVPALQWLCLIPAFRTFHLSAGDALTGAGYQRYRTTCQLLAASLNFGLNLFMIPMWSWRGAAWSSLMTDGFLAAANWFVLTTLIRKERHAISEPVIVRETEMADVA